MYIEGWEAYLQHGVQLGPVDAPVRLIEFADFECPFCAKMHQDLKSLRQRYPAQVALAFIHFPLPMHRFAESAARAAEWAGKQGRFEQMQDRLFEQQSAFGLKPWPEFATQAGVLDMAAFEACLADAAPLPRIVHGRNLGEQLNIPGTPAILINGWQLARPPAAEELDEMVRLVLRGKSPVEEAGG